MHKVIEALDDKTRPVVEKELTKAERSGFARARAIVKKHVDAARELVKNSTTPEQKAANKQILEGLRGVANEMDAPAPKPEATAPTA